MENIKKILSLCDCFDYGVSTISLIEMYIHQNPDFKLESAKVELLDILNDDKFDWVSLARALNIIPKDDSPFEKFNIDNALTFLGSFQWNLIVKQDAILSSYEKEIFLDNFRDALYSNDVTSVRDVLKHPCFMDIPFEIKHTFYTHFETKVYRNEDIIFYIKTIIWKYLFPSAEDLSQNDAIRRQVEEILRSYEFDNGWMDCSDILKKINHEDQKIDMYLLSTIKWSPAVQHKSHFRNNFTLGFKRLVKGIVA